MGKRHRQRRAHLKLIVGEAIKKTWKKVPVKVALKLLKAPPGPPPPELERYWRRLRGEAHDPGFKETELGELRSTIKKLTEDEIIDRMCRKATYELHKIEDARVFADIERAIAGAP